MFTTLGLLSVLTVADRAPARAPTSGDYRARIEVWTNRGDDPYGSGQSVRVYFRADQDAYVTILRVDTDGRSEEHTSELQSRLHLVCRLLLEKKKRDLGNGRGSRCQAELVTNTG